MTAEITETVIHGTPDLGLFRAAPAHHARLGRYVFPSTPRTKRPRRGLADWEHRAINDPERVAAHWPHSSNPCIATGPSGLVVVDLDVAKPLPEAWQLPGVVDGRDVLAVLAERAGQPYPVTHEVRTPTGGAQLYFWALADWEIGNSAGRLGPMIDTRGHGGFVVGAGAILDASAYDRPVELWNGGQYVVAVDVPPSPLPEWIADRLVEETPARADPAPVRALAGRGRGYAEAALRAELEAVLSCPNGERNNTLHRAAFSLGQLVSGGALDRTRVLTLLHRAGTDIGLSDRETRATVASGLKAGAQAPRGGAT